MMTVKFEGGKALEKELLKLSTATAKSVVRRAAKQALEPVAVKASILAPVNRGDLSDKIYVGTRAHRVKKIQPVEVYAGVDKTESKVGYQQEFGNINHGAQPFMRPAWDNLKMKVLVTFKDDLGDMVMKSVARAERKAAKARGIK